MNTFVVVNRVGLNCIWCLWSKAELEWSRTDGLASVVERLKCWAMREKKRV